MKTLKHWYLARLRTIAARKSARTPMSLVQEDKSLIQQLVLDSNKQTEKQTAELIEALDAKRNSALEQALLYLLIIGGCSMLSYMTFMSSK